MNRPKNISTKPEFLDVLKEQTSLPMSMRSYLSVQCPITLSPQDFDNIGERLELRGIIFNSLVIFQHFDNPDLSFGFENSNFLEGVWFERCKDIKSLDMTSVETESMRFIGSKFQRVWLDQVKSKSTSLGGLEITDDSTLNLKKSSLGDIDLHSDGPFLVNSVSTDDFVLATQFRMAGISVYIPTKCIREHYKKLAVPEETAY